MRRGFTLLEVLAAVAVLALSYTVLAGTAMQGLANEGEAHRRLRASLLADLQITEIESALVAAAPPVGVTEAEVEDYVVSVEARPFDLGAFALSAQVEGAPGGTPRAEGGAALAGGGTAPEGAGPPFQLLTAAPGAPSPLFEIIVRVSWMEGGFEQEVTRTTFGADPVAVQQAVASLGGGSEGDAAADAAAQDPDQLAPEPDAAEPEE